MTKKPLERLKHHVTGAIERGEKTAIEAVVLKHTPKPIGKYKANARLIAAAPDMFEALKQLVKSGLGLRGRMVVIFCFYYYLAVRA